MKDKILYSIIAFLMFFIVVTNVLDKTTADEMKAVKDKNAELLATIDKLKNESEKIKNALANAQEESKNLSQDLTKFANSVADSTIGLVVLNDVTIDGVLLRLDITYIYFEDCTDCEYGYRIVKEGGNHNTRTITPYSYIPIYMLNDANILEQVDWEYIVNLDYAPILEIFEDREGVILMRERHRPPSFEHVFIEN
ncbi:hypothetical protein [Ornithinibacillus bavariensis]|uniref:hypothetical protein n=1 Tax=Ornithinibacillus bavariensis TaxID=545502 RepID=UPI000EC83856|nr:hypothetical protein [Ornithinibacillus sp.]